MNPDNLRALATDGVVLLDDQVALIERNHPPHEGHWVLPGGMVERDETAREACVREVEEEIGMAVVTGAFVGLYDDPDRDERGNVSAAYLCRPVDENAEPEPREEPTQVEMFGFDELPEMGFDHGEIVRDAAASREVGNRGEVQNREL